MENGYLNSLVGSGTPRARRHEKSAFLQRSLNTKNLRKDDVMLSFGPDNTVQTSYSILEPDGDKFQTSSLRTHLSMNITEDPSITTFFSLDDDVNVQVGNLFQEFMDFYLSYPSEHEAFQLVSEYEKLCSDNVESLINILKKEAPIQQRLKKTDDILNVLQQERNTWRILNILYKDRIEKESLNEDETLMDTLGKRLSDKELITNLFLRNSILRHSQLVIDWLEKNAADDFSHKYRDKFEHFTEKSVSWEHTLHELNTNRSQLDIRPTRDRLITELDPDAPIRQRSHMLHSIDKENELRLLKYMFIYIRAGDLQKAQELAEKFGQPWLAATLEGWKPFHDPNYDNNVLNGNGMFPIEGNRYRIEGNKYRDIWKLSCWRTAQEPKISNFEQAIYGVFSGNLKAILPACETWDDCFWAYAKVYVDKLIEHELRTCTYIDRPLEALPAEYWDKDLDLFHIFEELQAYPSERVRKEGQSPYRIIQKYIILDDIDGLIEEFYSWIRQETIPSLQLLRLMTHLILFFRIIGRSTKDELCVAVIESYVQELINQQKVALVATYASTLPPAHQVIWYAKFLEGITDNTDRQMCLRFAEEAGLNIPLITKTVVENMRNKVTEDMDSSALTTKIITEEDKQKINALDWLVFDESQRSEAMRQANALMRVFVANEKLDAARQVFAKIPDDSITLIMKHSRRNGLSQLSAEDDNTTREYLCFRTYLEAYNVFNSWFHHFQHAKPRQPEAPSGGNIKFKDKVAYEHELKQYELELNRWQSSLMAQTKTTTDKLYNVLLFVSGGWMVDQRTEGPIDENRQRQMAMLRKLCIPQITNLLHSVLYNTGQYKASVQLADIIVSERNKLYMEFSIQELQQLLLTLRESSLALLERNLDPLGYPFQ